MSRVYRVGSLYGTTYFNTSREADRHRPGGELPDEVSRLDAAAECQRLHEIAESAASLTDRAALILADLLEECPATAELTEVGRRAKEFLTINPAPKATASDREGERSYGV